MKIPPSPQPAHTPHPFFLLPKLLPPLLLPALSSHLTRHALSPVYGSLPAPQTFPPAELALVLAVWLLHYRFSSEPRWGGRVKAALAIWGPAVPTVLSLGGRWSASLGPEWGGWVLAVGAMGPLVGLGVLGVVGGVVGCVREGEGRGVGKGVRMRGGAVVVVAWVVFVGLRKMTGRFVEILLQTSFTGSSFSAGVFSRFGLQAVLAACYFGFAGSRSRFVVCALVGMALVNPHIPWQMNSSRLNSALQPEGYSLLARQESLTGYISVLETYRDGFRVMRCDHSLLGGEWINRPEGYSSKLNEPIYAIFVMLEAVRLVETESSEEVLAVPDGNKTALVIGLGVGTSPSALIAHGIQTTSIEIDPVVHDFATKYFNLANHTSIIGDAITIVKDMQTSARKSYDYIIHDVFTGGAEPLELFTGEFLQHLSNLLSKDGTIAINYAGDLLLPSARSVAFTILSVFPTCRTFRETATPLAASPSDFTNLVFFCRKTADEFVFRNPVPTDLLGSLARKEYLLPKHEVDPVAYQSVGDEVITNDSIGRLGASQRKSKVGHWHVMRSVLPDAVWENW